MRSSWTTVRIGGAGSYPWEIKLVLRIVENAIHGFRPRFEDSARTEKLEVFLPRFQDVFPWKEAFHEEISILGVPASSLFDWCVECCRSQVVDMGRRQWAIIHEQLVANWGLRLGGFCVRHRAGFVVVRKNSEGFDQVLGSL